MDSPVPAPPPPDRLRRSLSAPSGPVRLEGDPAAGERLRRAFLVPPLPERFAEEERALVERSLSVHLFHGFAARTHPLTARHLLEGVAPGQLVFDPFLGSGTVAVEAALRGARGAGMDIGELQVRLSRFKATPMPSTMRSAFLTKARLVAEASSERVRSRTRPSRNWDAQEHYEPHVYLELCGLREAIDRHTVADPPLREGLLLVLSSIVLKASRQEAESSDREVRRALGKGLVSQWFLRRAEEAERLLGAFCDRVPKGTARPLLQVGDARQGPAGALPGPVDVLLTSPPYLGVYDYAAHQARRSAWLDIDEKKQTAQRQGEIGARTGLAGETAEGRVAQYRRDTEAWLSRAAALLRPGAPAFVLIGDGLLAEQLYPGDALLREAATAAGLRYVASCSVERLGGRAEHLVELCAGT